MVKAKGWAVDSSRSKRTHGGSDAKGDVTPASAGGKPGPLAIAASGSISG
jgi:hypothetical protein